MSFPVNVDSLFTFKDQCTHSPGASPIVDGGMMRASSTIGQQGVLRVDSCQYDLQVASGVREGISSDLTTPANVASELAWSTKPVRDEYKGIMQAAKGYGLVVVRDKVILFGEPDDDLAHSFSRLQVQVEVR